MGVTVNFEHLKRDPPPPRLVLTNLALYYVCRKRAFSPGSSTSSLIEQAHYNVAARHKLNKVKLVALVSLVAVGKHV